MIKKFLNRYTFNCFWVVSLLFSVGCTSTEVYVPFDGSIECEHCKMNILNSKFAAVIQTNTGKNYVFDAVECMIPYFVQNKEVKDRIETLWVCNYAQPGKFLNARTAVYLFSPQLESPMSGNVAAFENEESRGAAQQSVQESVALTWTEVEAKFLNQP